MLYQTNFQQPTQGSWNWKARPHGGGRERAEAKSRAELAADEVPRREGWAGEAGEAVQGEAAGEHGGGKGVGGKQDGAGQEDADDGGRTPYFQEVSMNTNIILFQINSLINRTNVLCKTIAKIIIYI